MDIDNFIGDAFDKKIASKAKMEEWQKSQKAHQLAEEALSKILTKKVNEMLDGRYTARVVLYPGKG